MDENEISFLIRKGIFTVYHNLGPGLLESVYETVLTYELKKLGLDVDRQVTLSVEYDSILMDLGFKIDLLVNEKVIVEIKSIENLQAVHHKQLLTYLKLSDLKLGILVNFNTSSISDSIFRKVNNL